MDDAKNLDHGYNPDGTIWAQYQKPRRHQKKPVRRQCGICGELFYPYEMVRDEGSDTGWICNRCFLEEHPEYEDWGEY